MAIGQGRKGRVTQSNNGSTAAIAAITQELNKVRGEIKRARRRQKQLPSMIQTASEEMEQRLEFNEPLIDKLSRAETRFSNLAEQIDSLIVDPNTSEFMEHVNRYATAVEKMMECVTLISKLETENMDAINTLTELEDEEQQLEVRFEEITQSREELLRKRDDLIIATLVPSNIRRLAWAESGRRDDTKVRIGHESISGACATYHANGRVTIPKSFTEQINLLRQNIGLAAD